MSRLHHVALGARDVATLAAFYRDVFELTELRRFFCADGSLRSIWLDLEGCLLMIEHTLAVPRSDEARAGVFLLAFRVSSERQSAFEHALAEAGAAIETRTQFSSYARDPEGNRIAISHYPEVFALEPPGQIG